MFIRDLINGDDVRMVYKLKSSLFSVLMRLFNVIDGHGLGKIPGMWSIYDVLFQWFWPEKNIIEIQGSKMYLNIHDKSPSMRRTFRNYATRNEWEPITTKIFENIVGEGDTVVDCGANIGYFTLLAAKLVGKNGKVYSFEPEKTNYEYILKNIELNGYNNVTVVNKAISDKSGMVRLYIHPSDTGHHTINQYDGITDDNRKSVEIESTSLDDFFKENVSPVNVIKMDIEGAEPLAFLGGENTIAKNKNLRIFLEFYPQLIIEMGGSPREFANKILKNYNFKMFAISEGYDDMKDADLNILKISNSDELMKICKDKESYVNLYLERGDCVFEKLLHDIV